VNNRLPLVHEVGHPKEFLSYPHGDIMYFDYMPPCMEVFDKDVYVVDNSSAGGLGDPIERDPALQKADLDNGLTNEEISRNMYCIAVHYDEKAKEWKVDDEETRKLRAAKRKERLSRGVPVEQYWQQARQRILDKKLDPMLREAYQSSMKLSQGFTRDYKDFWALPDDFAF
jgi:acetone carboxylase, alpha subunit